MTKLKKSVVLILAIIVVLISVNSNIFASTIQQRPANNSNSNNTSNQANNTTNQPTNNTSNSTSNNTSNTNGNNNTNSIGGGTTNNTSRINTSNSAENLPYTGIGDKYFNFALVILLALVLGMFSLVQYNKIIKKEDQN